MRSNSSFYFRRTPRHGCALVRGASLDRPASLNWMASLGGTARLGRFASRDRRARLSRLASLNWLAWLGCTAGVGIGVAAASSTPQSPLATPSIVTSCLESGDGYLRAHLGGAIEAKIDWPNSGTLCQGEPKDDPAGVRLSFQRSSGSRPDLLFVFGITGVREGKVARDAGVNLTVIVQGSSRIYGTLGDARCTVDSLSQRPLRTKGSYRVEARGFCTQPAHAVRGTGAVLVSTFEFAGLVNFSAPQAEPAARQDGPVAPQQNGRAAASVRPSL